MRPVRFIRDEHDCRTWALEQGLTMSREAFGDPHEPMAPRCPVCDGTEHTSGCELGEEMAKRRRCERELAEWREMALSQAGDAGLLARAMKAETENALLHEAMREEIDENLRLRELGGAMPDENITAMTERVIAERNALREQVAQLKLAEEGAAEAFGAVVQQKRDAQAKCQKLQGLLDACHKICGELARPSGI